LTEGAQVLAVTVWDLVIQRPGIQDLCAPVVGAYLLMMSMCYIMHFCWLVFSTFSHLECEHMN